MKVPSFLYGRRASVIKRCRKIASALVQSGQFASLEAAPLVDTDDQPGFLLVDPPRLFFANSDHFHCYALAQTVYDAVPASDPFPSLDAFMAASLAEPWRFLGVQIQEMRASLDRSPALVRPFIQVAIEFWTVFAREGKRYGPFVDEPSWPWDVMRNLHYALGRLGITNAELAQSGDISPSQFLDKISVTAAKI